MCAPCQAVLIEGKLHIAWLRREGAQLLDFKLVLQANAWYAPVVGVLAHAFRGSRPRVGPIYACCACRVGIAFDSDVMVGTAGAIIAVPSNGGSVQRYNLTSQTSSGAAVANVQDLTGTSIEQSGGSTIAKWTMPMLPASATRTRHAIFAYGSSNFLTAEVDNGATTLDLTAQPGCNASTSCHGHGTCNGTRCACGIEYTSIDCGVCAPGFSRLDGTVRWLAVGNVLGGRRARVP